MATVSRMRRTGVTIVLVLSALALGGCAMAGTSQSEALLGSDHAAVPDAREFASSGDSAGGVTVSFTGERQVIVTGSLTMTVEQPAEAAAEVARIVDQAGGRVDARTTVAPDGTDQGNAQLTVRIPTEALTATLESLGELGDVERVEQSKQDVTSQARDLQARITALRTSVDRLITLMASADTTADLISIESALAERQSNLESLESQKRSLDDQVDMSTFTVYLGSEADAPVDEPDTFLSGLLAGWNALIGFFSFVAVAFGVLLPWLVLAAIVTFGVVLVLRRRSASTVKETESS